MLSSPRIALALGAVCLSLLALCGLGAASALAGPTVTVRVEGESSTLLGLTSVTLEAPEPESGCPADSATAAINLAVNGHWDHGDEEGSKGDFTETILGETHAFTHESDTWAVWINDKWASGICEDLLGPGDEVLLVADHEPAPFEPTVLPLVFSDAPATVVAGVPFEVDVNKIHTRAGTFPEVGEGISEPEPGVTVSAGSTSAITAGDGSTTLTLPLAGTYTLSAHKSGDAPSAPVTVCVRASAESACGAPGPSGQTAPAGSVGVAASREVAAAPYRGPFALVADVSGLIDGHVYPHADAPRVLAGTIRAHSAVSSVSLELRRRYRGRCFAYDGTRERFLRARCGAGSFFKASSGGVFSYLLPAALGPGRYVLDIRAADVAGNRTTLARGTSRLVFYVR